uniref:Uncharacterized protein n=1 Tax=Meloidogyne incognita TaxID=6306 RepID=A0A914NZ76_MELIC
MIVGEIVKINECKIWPKFYNFSYKDYLNDVKYTLRSSHKILEQDLPCIDIQESNEEKNTNDEVFSIKGILLWLYDFVVLP